MTDRELLQQALHWLDDKEGEYTGEYKNLIEAIKARLAQPKKEWVGLTKKQKLRIWGQPDNFQDPMRFARAIEAKLKEKNDR